MNHMKIQQSIIFVKKNLNKYLKDKKYCEIRGHCHYTGEYTGAEHSIPNLKYSVLKKIPLDFQTDLIMINILS